MTRHYRGALPSDGYVECDGCDEVIPEGEPVHMIETCYIAASYPELWDYAFCDACYKVPGSEVAE